MLIDFRPRRAFTLLEIVLVVAILILFVLLLIPAFHKETPVKLTPEATPAPAAVPEPEATPAPAATPPPKSGRLTLPTPAPAAPAPEPDNAAPDKPDAEAPEKPAEDTPAEPAPKAGGQAVSAPAEQAWSEEAQDRFIAKIRTIVFPALELRDAPLREAVDFLQKKAVELDRDPDPSRRGVSVVLDFHGVPGDETFEPRVTVSLRNVSFLDAMKAVAAKANYRIGVGRGKLMMILAASNVPYGEQPAPVFASAGGLNTIPQLRTATGQILSKAEVAMIDAKLRPIVLPKIEFRDATVREAFDFLKKKSVELDPEPDVTRRGMNIALKLAPSFADAPLPLPPDASTEPPPANGDQGSNGSRITLSLKRVSLLDAMKITATQAGLKVVLDPDPPYAVTMVPKDAPTLAGSGAPTGDLVAREAVNRMERTLRQIIIPKLELRGATVREAVDILQKKTAPILNPNPNLPKSRSINLALKLESTLAGGLPAIPGLEPLPDTTPGLALPASSEPRITLSLSSVSWLDAMKAIAAQARLKVLLDPVGVVTVVPVNTPALAVAGDQLTGGLGPELEK